MAKTKINLLLLRGLVREQRHWGKFPATLQECMPAARVHMLDLPGIGTEISRRSPAKMSGIAADLRTRFLSLKAEHPEPWVCVSISLGSMVALDWCSKHPEDFKGLVIINTSATDLSPPWWRLRAEILPKLLKVSQSSSSEHKERQILEFTTRMLGEDKDALAKEWGEFSLPRTKMLETAGFQITAALQFKCPAKVDLPLLALVSRRDQLTDPRCSLAIAKKLGVEAHQHPVAGHDLPLDDALWTGRKIQEFVAAL